MGVVLSNAVASSLADAVAAAIDADAAAGFMEVYTGTLPTDISLVGTLGDTLLLSINLAYPAMTGPATDGVADFDVSAPPSATVAADGSPGYFVIWSNGSAPIQMGKVGLYADPDADMVVDSLTWLTGESVEMNASTLTMPTGG